MSEARINRREVVRTAAGVAAGGVLVAGAGASSASASTSHSESGILGAWWVEHTDDPPADPEPGIAVVSFGAGGIIVTNDIRPAGPVSNGVWAMDGDRFKATFWGTTPLGPDVEPGSVRVMVRGHLRGNKIGGVFTATVFDATGAKAFGAQGTFSGTRIRP
ncbi:MAG: hypothetical protein WB473_07830 [Pedococcus sp.]